MAFKLIGKAKRPDHKKYLFFLGQNRKRIECNPNEVIAFYAKWEDEIRNTSSSRKTKLFEILDEYLRYSETVKSRVMYDAERQAVRLFKTFFEDMPLVDFKRKDVLAYRTWRSTYAERGHLETVSNATINRGLATLSSFFTWAICEEYYFALNPCFKTKLREDNQRFVKLSSGQLKELLEKAKERGSIYTAVMLGVFAGLRANEMFTLQWHHIDLTQGVINLDAANCKGKKGRVVALSDVLVEHLKSVRKANPFGDRVLAHWKTSAALRSQWDRLRATLSFRQLDNGLILRLHDLRHIFAGALLEADVPLSRIQHKLGHSDIGVTQRYAQSRASVNDHEDVNKIPDILGIKKDLAV